jgi:diguanylate cyclase (GGDEF)-like protein/PAS domain S-box-containing protein
MDVLTIILLLSIGSFVFGLLLLIFEHQKDQTQRIPFWVAAKFLQGTGSLLLFFRGAAPDFATVLVANSLLLLGCAYEAWAIFYLVGRPVSRRTHRAMTVAIVIVNLSTALLSIPHRLAVVFLFQSFLYCLPGWVLLAEREAKSWLRAALGFSFLLLTVLNFLCGFQFLLDSGQSLPPTGNSFYQFLPIATFCMLLISGFSMLLLTIERSNRLLRATDASLKKTEVQYRRIVETAIEGILAFDHDFTLTYVNQNLTDMLGYTREEMLGRNIREFIPEDQQDDHTEQMKKRAQGQDGVYERKLRRKDGSTLWTLVSAKALMDEAGQYSGSFAMLTDINARKQLEAALQESEAKYRMFIETAIEGVISLDNERRLTFVNRQFASMLGYPIEEMLGQPYEAFMPADQWADAEVQQQIRARGQDAVYERCFLCKDGSRYWTLVSAKAILDAKGQCIGSFGMLTDINERKRLEDRLKQQATTDGLTGVVNRRYFLELAAREIRRTLRLNHPLALALIDIDYFKHINDTYGHAVGDEALLAVTRFFLKNIREADIFARFGGDEFVLLLPETCLDQAQLVLERLCRAFIAQPVDLGGNAVPITLSVGIAQLTPATDALDVLLEGADQALYQAKEAGRNCVSVQSGP